MIQSAWTFSHAMMNELYEEQRKRRQTELWHYTSFNAVLGIFGAYDMDSSKTVNECTMYASNIRYMNDSREYEEGTSSYDEYVGELKEKKEISVDEEEKLRTKVDDNIYLVSLCEEGDLLSQWKWYGKNSGVSICFDFEHIQYLIYSETKNGKEIQPSIYDRMTRPLRLQYGKREQKRYFDMLISKYGGEDSPYKDLLSSVYVPFCKDEAFVEEKEHRLVFFIPDSIVTDKNTKVKVNMIYNTNEVGRPKPALKVKMKYYNPKSKPYIVSYDEGNIITKMVVGPGNNQEMIFNCLIHVFDRKNYQYHSEKDDKSRLEEERRKTRRKENKLSKAKIDHKVHIVKCNDGVKRECYKCENGIIIMKSSAPFRA